MRFLSGLLFAACTIMSGTTDRITLPPASETFVSPSGEYRFIIEAVDGWKTLRSTAQMVRVTRGRQTLLWRIELPNRYRPKFAAVTNQGYTVTFDDWEHINSPDAIAIYDPQGKAVRRYSFDAMVSAIGQDRVAVSRQAKTGLGYWLAGPPLVDKAGAKVLVPAAGGRIRVDPVTGSLEFVR